MVAEGESNGWHYWKYSNGWAICSKTFTHSPSVTYAWGSIYVGETKSTRQAYPFAFVDIPQEYPSVHSSSAGYFLIVESGNNIPTTSSSGVYNIARGTSATSSSADISLLVIGRWK